MADGNYDKKLESLRRYIPFLVNMMTELKVKGNREAQLNKIQSLHDMITDTRKKLKLETLNRCEEVLTNIYFKVNPQLKTKGLPSYQQTLPGIESPNRSTTLPGIESPRSTPASPSPPRDVVASKPITIPTEKVNSSSVGSSSLATKKSHLPKVDVYSNVVINDAAKVSPVIAAKVPDMSKPPISLDDLKTLEDDVQQKISDATFAHRSVEDLQEFRKELELQLRIDSITSAMSPEKSNKEPINTTVRNNPSLSSKKLSFNENKSKPSDSPKALTNPTNPTNEIKTPAGDKKSRKEDTSSSRKSSKESTPSKSPQKVVKESSSIFGSLLSSIDNKLLEDKKKSKKSDGRSSVTLNKEESGSTTSLASNKVDITDEAITKNLEKSSEANEQKRIDSHKQSSEDKEKHKSKKKEKRKDKSRDKTDDEKGSSSKKDKKKDKHKSKEHKDEHRSSKSLSKKDDETLTPEKEKEVKKKGNILLLSDILLSRSKACSEKNANLMTKSSDTKEVSPSSTFDPDKNSQLAKTTSEDNTTTVEEAQPKVSTDLPKTSPVYKRLADKYNPKPKSKTTELEPPDVDKAVSDSIESFMKVSPAKPLLSTLNEPKAIQGEKVTQPSISQSNTSGLQIEPKPVQLPDILQKIFSKPLLGDIIPKRLNENNMFPLSTAAQNRAANLVNPMTKAGVTQPPEPPILSPPHRPLNFQPPEVPRSFPNFMSPPHKSEIMPSHDMGARPNALLPTPNLQLGILPTPPLPPTLPRGFSDHNPVMDMVYGTPRVDFDTPSTPMPDFGSPRVDFEPSIHFRNEQFNLNQMYIPPMHQERQMHSFDPRNQNFMGQPQFQPPPELNVFNNQLVPGMGFYGQHNQMPLVSPEGHVYMPEQNFYLDRSWQEKPRWNRDRRPGDPRNYREYKEMRERHEREAKAAQEKQKEIKDPRLAPRDSKDPAGEIEVVRDPRLVRDSDKNIGDKSDIIIRDPRLSRGREKSIDRERDPDKGTERGKDSKDRDFRSKSRDRERPRSRERAISRLRDPSDSRSRPRERESRFDKMYSRTNRAGSRSQSGTREEKNDEDESFISPLDSLYNAGEKGKTGRGYGVQNFKIPRKSRVDDVRRRDEKKDDEKRNNSRKICYIEISDSSDESDTNNADDNLVSENVSDIESDEEVVFEKLKDAKSTTGKQTAEIVKEKKKAGDKSEMPDLDTSRIKIVLKTGAENTDKEELNVWQTDSQQLDTTAEDPDFSNFISEYDREFQLNNKDQPAETVEKDVSYPVKSVCEDVNKHVKKTKQQTKASYVQVEEPSSSQDVNEIIKSPAKVAVVEKMIDESLEADSSKKYNDHQTSIESSQKNLDDTFKKPLESVEADSSKKSDGALTPQDSVTRSDEPSEQNILAHFFENLLKSKNKKDKKTALFSLIETFSDSFDTKEIQKIRKIIKVNEDDEEETDDEEKESKIATEKKDDAKESTQEVSATQTHLVAPIQEEQPVVGSTTEEVPADIKIITTKEPQDIAETQVNEVTKSSEGFEQSSIEENKSEESLNHTNESVIEALEPVLVSVGERIKNRKRNVTPSKPRKKGKTELDMLHEDIQDMFIRDGVLTATGKRMCRILKDDPTALAVTNSETSSEQPKKVRKKPGPKPKPKINKEEIQNSMKDMRVVIKKMPDTVMITNTFTTRQLRSRNRLSSYAESDDDGHNDQGTSHHLRTRTLQSSYAESDDDSQKSNMDNDTTLPEDNESIKSEIEGELLGESEDEDNKSHSSDGVSKPRIKRRRIPKWASGIIPKNKKKKAQSKSLENSPAPSRAASPDPNISNLEEFDRLVEPDKEYYYDHTNKTKMMCKLCKYSGHLLTGHYLKEHPQSEVLCSRLAPHVAAEAIKDFSINGKKYETITTVKMSTKYNYSCRVCGFTSTTSPIFFYEHVTTHTGEYRHQCGICEYYAVTGKTMTGHFLSVHPDQEKKAIRRTYTLAIVFGYICGECNFLQLKEKSVEDHANIFHLGEKTIIYKINMSTILDPVFDAIDSSREGPKALEPKMTDLSVASSENAGDNEVSESTPLPVPKMRKRPGPKLRVLVNASKESSAPVIKKKPGPKSKTMPLAVTEQVETAEKVLETPPIVPAKKKPGPKSKTQKLKLLVIKEKYTDDAESQETSFPAEDVSPRPTPSRDDEVVKEAPTRKRRRSLDKLISEDSGDDLDTIITLSSRSSRAAKEKATAKLKTLMESNEGLSTRKKLETDSTRKEKENDKETSRSSKSVDEKEDGHQGETEKDSNNETPEDKDESTQIPNDTQVEEMHPPALKGNASAKKDLNVFTCKTDILEEDAKKIEEERLRKMEELNKSIGSRTSKLDFVDKLSSRLNNEQSDKNSRVNIKQEPKDDFPIATSSRAGTPTMPVLEKELPLPLTKTPPLTKVSKSPVVSKKLVLEEDIPPPQSNINFRQNKPNSLFFNMIEKLQGKVNEAAVQQQRPSTSSQSASEEISSNNVQRSKTPEILISIGDLITASKKDNEIIFSCHANNCYVATKDKMVFQLHCKFGHKDLNMTSSLCEKCGVVIEITPDTSLLENLYDHLVFAHSDCIAKSSSLRMRRLSGDKLSVKQEILEKSLVKPAPSLAEPSSNEKDPQDFEAGLNRHVLTYLPPTSTVQVSSHVPTEHDSSSAPKQDSQESVSLPMETNQVEVSAPLTAPAVIQQLNEEAETSEATLELAEDNPFSFKIANVMSLAKLPEPENPTVPSSTSQNKPKPPELPPLKPVPPLTLITIAKQQPAVQQSHLIVKEAKLTSAELSRPKKAPKALQKFVDSPGDLYKCPHFYCMFSTNVRTFLERHLKVHKSDSEAMVPCVYCDMKTPWEHVPMHIDIRHVNCRFACSYCLYRACLKEYVCLHQEQAHSDKDFVVLSLPPHKATKKFSVADTKIDCRTLCEPFRCACLEAGKVVQKDYLFETEFANHLNTVHNNTPVDCAYHGCKHRVSASMMLNHWAMFHGICTYQCGYCKTSSKEITRMYTHFSQLHPSSQPDILVRVNDTLPKDRELGFSKEAFERLGHIKKIPQNLLVAIGKRSQRSIKMVHFNSGGLAEESATSTASEVTSTGSSSLTPILTLPTLQQVQAVPQIQPPKIIISKPNLQLLVATTNGGSEKVYFVPASMVSPQGKSVMSMAPINKVVAQTSPATKTVLGRAGESVLSVEAVPSLPNTTISAITGSNLPQVPMKIGDTAIRSLKTTTESLPITSSSSHATIAVLSRSLPTTVSSSSPRSLLKTIKTNNNKAGKDFSNTNSGTAIENSQLTGSQTIKIFNDTTPLTSHLKLTATIKSTELPSDALTSKIIEPTTNANDFVEPANEEASSQHSSTGLSEDDILQSAIQSILDADDLSDNSSFSGMLATESTSTVTSSFNNFTKDSSVEHAPNTNKDDIVLIEDNKKSQTAAGFSTAEPSSVSKTDPPPLVLISKNLNSDKNVLESKTSEESSSQRMDNPSISTNPKIAQEQNESTEEQVAPVEHVEVTGDVPVSSLLLEDVDPLNIDALESNDDSNLDAPMFDDINVGIDSPPEDPLTITPTFNSNLVSTDDPLSIDESAGAVDPLEVDEVQADDSESQSVNEGSQDPLMITNMRRSMSMVSNSDDESDSSSSEKGKKLGLMGYQLYRCFYCSLSFSNVQTFRSHVANALTCKKVGVKQYQCVHCEKSLKTPNRLADHIQTHGVPRFSCSLCNEKFPTVGITKLHMKNRHNIQQTNLVPLKSDRFNMDLDEFMVKPGHANQPTNKEAISEISKQTVDENTFNPDQIDGIPIRQIFSNNVKCGKCNYQTKVRVNIVRHLQMHLDEKTVPDMAPVNPVPCLEKNEKMFDKMINLAASSITGRMGGTGQDKEKEEDKHPEFVPSHRRFVCAAQGCSYLCPEEANLKHHLMALHSDESQFMCGHCKIKIEPTDPESVIKHLKHHGLHLYKCHYCRFVHHLKHKVEKHITDGHLDAVVKVITVRYMESEPLEFGANTEEAATPPPTSSAKFKPWRCCMCKAKSLTKEDIQYHVLHRHDMDSQYKCTLCAFKSDQETSFKDHFTEIHPNHEIDIIFVYQKVEEELPKDDHNATPFDTTPLWQRDKPRVRHIRGILFDESSPQPAKSPKKTPKTYPGPSSKASTSNSTSSTPTSNVSKNLFDCIDAVARGTAETLKSKAVETVITSKSGTAGGSSQDDNNSVSKQGRASIGKKGDRKNISEEKAVSSGKKEVMKSISQEEAVSGGEKNDEEPLDSGNDDVIEIKQAPSIIIIDSDDSDTEQKSVTKTDDVPKSKDKDSKSKPVSKNRGVKRQGTKDLLQEAVKMAKIEEPDDVDSIMASDCSKEQLMLLYGSFGTPHNKQWKCPKCHQFKSKRVGDFMFHIYKDFNVYRYKCKVCSDFSITYKYMLDHIKLHPGLNEDIIEPLPPNIKLETWIHMVIREQSLTILKNSPLMKKRPVTGPTDISCYFCNDRFMSMPDCCEHMLYHWVMMPYQCQHCPNEFYTVYDLKHHYKIEHSDLRMYLDPKGPTLERAVQCIENIKKRPIPRSALNSPARKKAKVEDTKDIKEPKMEVVVIEGGLAVNKCKKGQKTAPASPNTSKIDVINIDDDDDDLVVVSKTDDKVPNEDEVFACDACAFMADTEILVVKHLLDAHGIKTNKFHSLSKKRAEESSPQDMACNICNQVFPELKLRRHFLDNHLGGELFSPYRFKCYICSKKYLILSKVKLHFRKCHSGMAIKYQSLIQHPGKNSLSKDKLYSCTMCSYTNVSSYLAAMRAHLRGHLKPVVCNHCNARVRYQSEIVTHNYKDHPDLLINFSVLDQVQKEYTETLKAISKKAVLLSDADVVQEPESTSTALSKNIAKKSTSAPFKSPKGRSEDEAEYSYYGVLTENLDLSNILTTFELDGLEYTTTAEQMMKMFNMDTFVDVSDCVVDVLPLDKS